MYSEPGDTFIFIGTAITVIGLIYVAGWSENRKVRQLQQVHKRFATNYARRNALLATSSKAVWKGYRVKE